MKEFKVRLYLETYDFLTEAMIVNILENAFYQEVSKIDVDVREL